MYIYMYIFIHVCLYIHIYICIYIYNYMYICVPRSPRLCHLSPADYHNRNIASLLTKTTHQRDICTGNHWKIESATDNPR